MGQIGASAGLGGASGFASGFLGGLLATAGTGYGALVGGLVFGIIGATTSAAASYFAQQRPESPRTTSDMIQTDSVRIKPVPVIFGRNRLGGNYIGVGIFWGHDSYKPHKRGEPVRIMNALLGLCEGPIQYIGGIHLDGELLKAIRARENLPCKVLRFSFYGGTNSQPGAPSLTDPRYGYVTTQPLQVPFRSTAYLDITAFCGYTPRMPQITVDAVGPDYTIRRSGFTGESNPSDVPRYGFYDVGQPDGEGHFYYTLLSSGASSSPYGLVRMGRQGKPREHTPPPSGISTIVHGWYFGKHDVLIYQDPSDPSLMHLGYWNISPTSADWEHVHPSNQTIGDGYANPILAWYHDEFHSMLHTLHDDGTTRYILRWNVLTGHIDRINTDLAAGSFKALQYSIDLAYYVVARDSAFLALVDPNTGETLKATSGISTASAVGVCVSGQQVGVLTAGLAKYWDVFSGDIGPTMGDVGTDVNPVGSFGGTVSATQSSFTGQVCVTKTSSSTAAFCQFIPSTVEDIRDINANGTSGMSGLPITSPDPDNYGAPEPNFQQSQIIGSGFFPADSTVGQYNPVCNSVTVTGVALQYETDWIRDWSYRTYGAWSLKALEGNSSLAAACWAVTVDEPTYDSARWGAAFDPKLFSLPSFEGLHAWCVGTVRFANSPDTFPASRTAERYKFDFTLDQEMPVSSLWMQHLMMACQGFSYSVGGIFHVGVPKPGQLSVWHYDERTIEENSLGINYTGTVDGVNRVRIQYRNTLDEFRHDFAEAEDVNAITATGRVQLATLTVEGCGRGESAALLAKAVLDQSAAGRRQMSFGSGYLSYILAPSDAIEVSSVQCGLDNVKIRLASIKESSSAEKQHHFALDGAEFKPVLDSLLDQLQVPAQPGTGTGSNADGTCILAAGPSLSEAQNLNNVFNEGSVLPAGTYTATYMNGAYTHSGHAKYFVHGYQFYTGTTLLCDAPSVADPAGGYDSEDDAETANFGQSVTFTLAVQGQIYIYRPPSVTAYTQQDCPLPYWQLCQTS